MKTLIPILVISAVILAACGSAPVQDSPQSVADMQEVGASPPAQVPPSGPESGTVLYQADWSGGMNGWAGSSDWKTVNSTLVNDGTNWDYSQWIIAPYKPGDIADYAVEAEIQVVRSSSGGGCNTSFGIVARAEKQEGSWTGYLAGGTGGYGDSSGCANTAKIWRWERNRIEPLTEQGFNPGTDWHTYRVEVQGNNIRLLIDGSSILETIDNHYLSGGQVGLWSNGVELNVRSFKVIAL